MLRHFSIKVGSIILHARLLSTKAPFTCKAIIAQLPFTARGVQARFAGEEIWIPQGPQMDIPKENTSSRPMCGSIGYVPLKPRQTLSGSMAIIYGEAKLSARVNVFACVVPSDAKRLKKAGKTVWLQGAQKIVFKK